MNQELENFDMLIVELEESLENENFQAFKTLINIYDDIYNNYNNQHFKDLYKNGVGEMLVTHIDKLKYFEHKLVNVIFPQSVKDKEYKQLHNIQYLIDKLKQINFYIGRKVSEYLKGKEINDAFNRKVSDHELMGSLLNKSIEGGFLVTQVKENLRGKGKTEALIKKANELDITLIVGSHVFKKIVDEKAIAMGINIDCKYVKDTNSLRGHRFKNNKFLVDDSVSNLLIRELIRQGKEFVGGFNSLNDSLSTYKQLTLQEQLHKKLNELQNEWDIVNAVHGGRAVSLPQYKKLLETTQLLKEVIKVI